MKIELHKLQIKEVVKDYKDSAKEVCNKCGKPTVFLYKNEVKQHCIGYSSGDYHKVRNFKGDNTVLGYSISSKVPSCHCNDKYSPGTVLDPFSGSGTTLLACRSNNVNGIGIELNPHYTQIAKKRLFGDNQPLFDDFKIITE
jgi:hypothetical protein